MPTHTHVYTTGRSGSVETCRCGRFRHVNVKPENVIVEQRADETISESHHMPTRQRIDRTTTHTCPGLERDIAYFANIGQAYFHCVNCNATIPTQYVQFSMLCAACRFECTDDSDVAPTACNYCNETL